MMLFAPRSNAEIPQRVDISRYMGEIEKVQEKAGMRRHEIAASRKRVYDELVSKSRLTSGSGGVFSRLSEWRNSVKYGSVWMSEQDANAFSEWIALSGVCGERGRMQANEYVQHTNLMGAFKKAAVRSEDARKKIADQNRGFPFGRIVRKAVNSGRRAAIWLLGVALFGAVFGRDFIGNGKDGGAHAPLAKKDTLEMGMPQKEKAAPSILFADVKKAAVKKKTAKEPEYSVEVLSMEKILPQVDTSCFAMLNAEIVSEAAAVNAQDSSALEINDGKKEAGKGGYVDIAPEISLVEKMSERHVTENEKCDIAYHIATLLMESEGKRVRIPDEDCKLLGISPTHVECIDVNGKTITYAVSATGADGEISDGRIIKVEMP